MLKAPKVGPRSRVRGHARWWNTTEFLAYGFLIVFTSNYRPTTHRLATIHERDQPTTNDQPTNDITTLYIALCASQSHYSE